MVLFSRAKLSLLDPNDWRNVLSSEDWLRVLKLLRLTVNTEVVVVVLGVEEMVLVAMGPKEGV